LLSRYAPLSVEMQTAIIQDQATIEVTEDGEFLDLTYEDGKEAGMGDVIAPEKLKKVKLEMGTKEYNDCVAALKTGTYGLNDISRKYHLTDEVTENLMSDAGI
jgi:recombinational DNA repair protein RecT